MPFEWIKIPVFDDDNKENDSNRNDEDDDGNQNENSSLPDPDDEDSNENNYMENPSINLSNHKELDHSFNIKDNTNIKNNVNYNDNNKRIKDKEDIIQSNNTLDEGTHAFIKWLSSDKKKSFDNHIIVKQFVHSDYALLQDNSSSIDVLVRLQNSIPFCKYCKTDDCLHVGFTICLEQIHSRGETIESSDNNSS